ncbi:hypothetical protein RWE15_21940 [Virgibacillus halophilus]|uniref:Uncharacterized protein n=1 Tax=Tigheibacillus halophilus TaxID=361280 RepID=A0ABU5CAZ4_9BACI|nr:hypothetical protein [Virgibacillus halophilus]
MKQNQIIRMFTGLVLLIALITIPLMPPVKHYLSIPNKVVTVNNNSPMQVADLGSAVKADSVPNNVMKAANKDFYAKSPGEGEILYKLAGLPIKKDECLCSKE